MPFKLEPYKGPKTRHSCPSCGKHKTFSLYVDTTTGEPLALNVGRCNREVNCGYHYTPKTYFQDNLSSCSRQVKILAFKAHGDHFSPIVPPSFINGEILEKTLHLPANNALLEYLNGLFSVNVTTHLAQSYLIGTANHWPGATVFWQVDIQNRIHTGKIILYNSDTGKRVKEPFNHIAWAHSVLKLKNYNLEQCLFGEHLLNTSAKPVAIVESEKTAIISSVFMPQFLWLATGGLSNINIERFKVLTGRGIFLFPDLKCYKKWRQKADEIENRLGLKILVSNFLEANASTYEKEQGLDIADFLVKRDNKFGWALSHNGYPIFWDYKT